MPVQAIVGPTTATTHLCVTIRGAVTRVSSAAQRSNLYLYRWSPESALSLVFSNGIDEDSTGIVQPPSDIVFEIAGLPDTAVVVISDDDVEFGRTTPTTARADWDCDRHAFPGSWRLTIAHPLPCGITR